jgi:DNA-binding PadR family transcriptional regulator
VAVREGLLALLAGGERHGYQLKTEFEAATGGTWTLNVGQVYTTLDRLHRDGLVDVAEDDGQKRYSLTAAGREELSGWWAALPGATAPPRDELLLKVLLAIEQGRDHALDVLTRHRTALIGLLQQHRRATGAAGASGPSLAASLAADALAVRAEADLRWLDLCEARLVRSLHQPTTPNGALDG